MSSRHAIRLVDDELSTTFQLSPAPSVLIIIIIIYILAMGIVIQFNESTTRFDSFYGVNSSIFTNFFPIHESSHILFDSLLEPKSRIITVNICGTTTSYSNTTLYHRLVVILIQLVQFPLYQYKYLYTHYMINSGQFTASRLDHVDKYTNTVLHIITESASR